MREVPLRSALIRTPPHHQLFPHTRRNIHSLTTSQLTEGAELRAARQCGVRGKGGKKERKRTPSPPPPPAPFQCFVGCQHVPNPLFSHREGNGKTLLFIDPRPSLLRASVTEFDFGIRSHLVQLVVIYYYPHLLHSTPMLHMDAWLEWSLNCVISF